MAEPGTHHLGKLRAYLGDDRSAILLPFLTATFTASLTTAFALVLEAAWYPAVGGAIAAAASGIWLLRLHLRRLTVEAELGTLYYVSVLAGDQRDPDEATFNHLRRWFVDSQTFTARLSLTGPKVSDESQVLDIVVDQFRNARRYDTPATAQSLITNCLWHFGVAFAYRLDAGDAISDHILWHSQPRGQGEGQSRSRRRRRLHQAFDRLDLRDHVVDLAPVGIVRLDDTSTVDEIKGRYLLVDPTDATSTGFQIDDVAGGEDRSVLVLVAFTDQVAGTVSTDEFEALHHEIGATAVCVFRRLPPGPQRPDPIPDDQQPQLAIDAADYLLAVLDAYPHGRITLVAGITRAQQILLGARLRARCDGQRILDRIDFANYDRATHRYHRVRYAPPVTGGTVAGGAPDSSRPRVVNLTAQAIVVRGPDGRETSFAPSGAMVRRTENTTPVGTLDICGQDVPVVHQVLGDLRRLPDPEPGVIYIVSCLAALACPDRRDVFYPAGEIRDETGRLVAVSSLGIVEPTGPAPAETKPPTDPRRDD